MYYATLNLWKFLGEGLDKRWISVERRARPATTEDFLRPAGRSATPSPRPTARCCCSPPARCRTRSGSCASCATTRPPGSSTSAPRRRYAADLERIDWFKAGDHARVLDTMPEFMRYRPEAMFAHYLMMIGALGEGDCTAPARQYGDYENSIGTGQVHLWFDRPEGGFPGRTAPRRSRLRPADAGPDLTAAG